MKEETTVMNTFRYRYEHFSTIKKIIKKINLDTFSDLFIVCITIIKKHQTYFFHDSIVLEQKRYGLMFLLRFGHLFLVKTILKSA